MFVNICMCLCLDVGNSIISNDDYIKNNSNKFLPHFILIDDDDDPGMMFQNKRQYKIKSTMMMMMMIVPKNTKEIMFVP